MDSRTNENKDKMKKKKKKKKRITSSAAIFVLIIAEVVKTAGHKSTKNRGVRKSLCPPPRPPRDPVNQPVKKKKRKKEKRNATKFHGAGTSLGSGLRVVARGRQFKVTNSAIKGARGSESLGHAYRLEKKKKKKERGWRKKRHERG